MVIGILQVELLIQDAQSLKDKRRVVMSLKDRLHQANSVAIAEVDRLDAHQIAVLGIVTVSNSVPVVQGTLSKILDRLREHRKIVLNDHHMEVLSGR